MLKRSVIRKTIAVFLIFTLTFANFALVTKSYATTIFDTVFSGSSDTGNKNVEFDAYFNAEKEKSYSAISAINGDSVKLSLDLKVQDSGYLKNAQIQIKEKEEASELNFKIEGEFEESDYVKSFENNSLILKQINNNSQVNLELPLIYNQEEYITLDKLNKDFDVVLTGKYVNSKAEEVEINKVVTLNLTWTDEREVKLSSEVTKYIPYLVDGKNGVILQTLIKVDSTAEKSGAVKSTNLEIEVPKIENAQMSKINVIAKSTLGTDGKTAEEVEFSEDNWKLEDGVLTINKENKAELIKDEIINEDNTLLEENENAEEVEKYFSASGIDEYLVTYTFENVNSTQQTLNSNVKAKVTTFGKEDLENKTEQQFEYQVSEQLGDIVTYEVQNDTESISKGYTYINYKNENGLYEMVYNSKEIVNISYKDIVEEIYVKDLANNYVDKNGQTYGLNDVYYKSISVSKSNFEELLGEEGTIEILRQDGTVIAKFTKDTEPDESGNLVYNFDEYTINNVTIKTSKPQLEGNLIFSIAKVQKQTSYDKSTFATFDYMEMNSKAEAKYTYVENLVDGGEVKTKIKLEDTITKADLELSTTSISTLEPTNVEMKIKLNNQDITSDIYGNSTFEILLPEYIEDFEITDYNMAYGDGLNLSNVEAFYNEAGRLVVKATVEGMQTDLSSGTITNGTNIVFNSTITVNKYTPLMEKDIELKVINSEATNYVNDGVSKTKIIYSAPTGVVAVNTIKNYDGNGNEITSIKQGTKKATISTYSNSVNPAMEFIVMNNNSNTISNISILGRIPFEGNKDVLNGEDLGTTLNTLVTSRIISDSNNNTNFKIYYSANGEATKDLNDSSNGWTEEIDLGDIKSFLIIPEDTNYEMQSSQILKFSYEFNIPENLDFNNDIYTDFAVYYTNNSELSKQDEIIAPDIVYLTTGIGPQLELETTVDCGEKITEKEELTITSKVTNTGKVELEDVKVTIPIPEGTTYSYATFDENEITAFQEGNNIIYNIPKVEIGGSKDVELKVMVNEVTSTDGLEIENDSMVNTININSKVIAKNLNKEIVSDNVEVKVSVASLVVEVANKEGNQDLIKEEELASFSVAVTNTSNEKLNNVQLKVYIDNNFSIKDIFLLDMQTGNVDTLDGIDQNAKEFIYNIDSIESLQTKFFAINATAKKLQEGSLIEKGQIYATVENDNVNMINSNSIEYTIGKPILTISQRTNTDTYVKTGNTIEYIYNIKNEGTYKTGDFRMIENVPNGLRVEKVAVGDRVNYVSERNEVNEIISLNPGEEIEVKINAVAEPTDSIEYSVNSKAVIKSSSAGEIESNEITHIVEDAIYSENTSSKEKYMSNTNNNNNNNSIGNYTSVGASNNIVRTYKITGCVWIDDNANGIRDNNEKMKSGSKVILVDSDTGIIKDTITTDSTGTYTFSGLTNGNYFVLFEYDAGKYNLTAYQKEGVNTNNNSDVISTQIEQDGKLTNGAVTDVITISDGSISNIDMGLVIANTFDLQLTKTVSKITIQNEAGTTTSEYDNLTFAKTEIAGKYLASSTAYIEYTMIVENKGDVEGYAKLIVDYIPEGLTFNSSMNPDWYTGTDGNLYTKALADKALAKGQKAEIKLILTKQMTEENTGMFNNTAEIVEDYNVYGLEDVNSKAGNKVESENDFGSANVIISVKTGEVFIYTSVILTTILLGGIAVFITVNKLKIKKRKEGGV